MSNENSQRSFMYKGNEYKIHGPSKIIILGDKDTHLNYVYDAVEKVHHVKSPIRMHRSKYFLYTSEGNLFGATTTYFQISSGGKPPIPRKDFDECYVVLLSFTDSEDCMNRIHYYENLLKESNENATILFYYLNSKNQEIVMNKIVYDENDNAYCYETNVENMINDSIVTSIGQTDLTTSHLHFLK